MCVFRSLNLGPKKKKNVKNRCRWVLMCVWCGAFAYVAPLREQG